MPITRQSACLMYMLNIVWYFQKQFYKIAIVSPCHEPKSVDSPQLIEQVLLDLGMTLLCIYQSNGFNSI